MTHFVVLYSLFLYSIVGFCVYSRADDDVEELNSRKAAIVALLSPVWPVLAVALILYCLWYVIANINHIVARVYRKVDSLLDIARNGN